ncbi:hypothetical protein A6F53_00065 [Levilactobacillus brevis]|nr:hypothetical protein A6F53_00065 [Levilactobacillus brevis]ATU70663.1 hypothetical protein CT113_10140 [Levilactobacillus brevis]
MINHILKRLNAQDANIIAEQFLKNKYHDRGMLKWQGFFLSDHTSSIKKEVNSPIPKKGRKYHKLKLTSVYLRLENMARPLYFN